MITGSVDSAELTTKTLRAGDYLIDPEKLAKDLVRTWLEANGLDKLIRSNSPYMNQLKIEIQHAVRIAYERGQQNALLTAAELRDIIHQPTVARQIMPPKRLDGSEMP